MKALILTGGKGTRLRPYTTVLPKPLMPIGERPILEILLRQLKQAGVSDVVLAVNYLYKLIKAIFQDGTSLGLKLSYSLEEKPLGTAGPIASVLDQMGENFLVLNGDLLTNVNFKNVYDEHCRSSAAATIAVTHREVKIDYGVLEISKDDTLVKYIEKPKYEYHVSMGINVFNAKAIAPHLVKNEALDIPDLVNKLLQGKKKVRCLKTDCLWLDIGRPDDYEQANELFADKGDELFLGLTGTPSKRKAA